MKTDKNVLKDCQLVDIKQVLKERHKSPNIVTSVTLYIPTYRLWISKMEYIR